MAFADAGAAAGVDAGVAGGCAVAFADAGVAGGCAVAFADAGAAAGVAEVWWQNRWGRDIKFPLDRQTGWLCFLVAQDASSC